MSAVEFVAVLIWGFVAGVCVGAWWARRLDRRYRRGDSIAVGQFGPPPTHVFPDGGDGQPANPPREFVRPVYETIAPGWRAKDTE